MRIGILTVSASRLAGGLFWSVRELATEFHRRGHDVQVFAVRDAWSDSDVREWTPVPVHLFDRRGPASFSYAPNLRTTFTRFNPQIVHTHGLWTYMSVVGERCAADLNCPLFISPRGMLDSWALKQARIKKWIALKIYEGRHLKRASRLHALNASEYQSIQQFALNVPIITIPNGVRSCTLGSPDTISPAILEAETRKILLFLSRLHPKKGLSPLLHGWSLAVSRNPSIAKDWCVAIAGWDQKDHESELKQLAMELRIESDVHFLGPLFAESKESAFKRAAAFVLPSFSEGLPVAVLEAWAYGLPVLMTEHCNLPEGFANNAAIQMSPNRESIANALAVLWSSTEEELEAMSKNAKKLIDQKFQWPVIADQMLESYKQALSCHAIPPDQQR